MNFRLLSRLLGIISLLIGAMMLFSLVWAWPALGHRRLDGEELLAANQMQFESAGFWALAISVAVSGLVGWGLILWGRDSRGQLYRKEAMAVVGLSWVLATILGAMPFWFAGVYRNSAVRLSEPGQQPLVYDYNSFWLFRHWKLKDPPTNAQQLVLEALAETNARGLSEQQLQEHEDLKGLDPIGELTELREDEDWAQVIYFPGEGGAPKDRIDNYRLRWVRLGIADALFESQSGFSTTGATVISDLEDPYVIPHCLLFWRSSTHFLGGLGIIVLFVVILGQGSAGKALMRAEMPGPTKEGSTARMQHTAWLFAAIYCVLNVVLAILLMFCGLTVFDAICHAFGTMATGGFSTYNKSVGAFDSALIDYLITLFMLLAGTNFTLLYFCFLRQPGKLLVDVEWRTYMAIIIAVTVLIVSIGIASQDFEGDTAAQRMSNAVRYGLFQVVAIITTTGYGTDNFDDWNNFGRGVLFLLMFVGGCAGSTGGGMKVIRHILFVKILRLEIEQAYHPTVVRPLRLGENAIDDPDLAKNILIYFGLILVLFVGSWMFVVAVEPNTTWGATTDHKLIDSSTAIAATLNNIGPGLGIVGATQNYANFIWYDKIVFVFLMMIGRLEIFSILVLFSPGFWRSR